MVTVGLLVRLVVKPGKEAEVTSFLEGGLALVQQEPATIAWFAIRLGPSEFGIFDAFPDDAGRQAHLGGRWRPRSWPRRLSCWRSHRSSSQSMSWRPSCLGSCRSEQAQHGQAETTDRPACAGTATMITVAKPVAACTDRASSTVRTGESRQAGYPRPDGGTDDLMSRSAPSPVDGFSGGEVSIWAGPVRSWVRAGSARPPPGGSP
jgi:hypothetical protein